LRSIPEPHAFSTVVFYGLKTFGCKTAQLSVMQRECRMVETPIDSIAVQRSENTRKNSFLNYESPALTAELQARDAIQLNHNHMRMTNLESVPSCSISEIPLASLPLDCRATQEPVGLPSVIL
jgi:hypothetical protein